MWRMGVALLLLLCFLVWGLNTVERAMLRTGGGGDLAACHWERRDPFLVFTILGHTYRLWMYPTVATLTHQHHQLVLIVAGHDLVLPLRIPLGGTSGR